MGARAYNILVDYCDKISEGVIVEMGASPLMSGEGSTPFFCAYAMNRKDIEFYCIDLDCNLINQLKFFDKPDNNIHIWCGDGLELLDKIDKPISLAYLDNFDYIPPDSKHQQWIFDQKKRYVENFGVELTNENSAEVHLKQTMKVVDKMAERSIILFDDTWEVETGTTFRKELVADEPHNGWYGKGATAVPWLLERGWRLLPKPMRGRDDWTALCNFDL